MPAPAPQRLARLLIHLHDDGAVDDVGSLAHPVMADETALDNLGPAEQDQADVWVAQQRDIEAGHNECGFVVPAHRVDG